MPVNEVYFNSSYFAKIAINTSSLEMHASAEIDPLPDLVPFFTSINKIDIQSIDKKFLLVTAHRPSC